MGDQPEPLGGVSRLTESAGGRQRLCMEALAHSILQETNPVTHLRNIGQVVDAVLDIVA